MNDEFLHQEITDKIIRAFYKVYNTLGYGFLEKVYENALALELVAMGLFVAQQKPLKVYYGQHLVGDYFADLIVNECVIIELKAVD
ncbi:MAG: GxxExxY protein, partial [Blastocatellia bacterium]